MEINTEIMSDRIVIKIAGRFDMDTQHLFRNSYRKLIKDSPRKTLVVDMAGMTYMDSSALGMLLLLRQDAETQGIAVGLARCTPFIADILRTAHFDRLFDIST